MTKEKVKELIDMYMTYGIPKHENSKGGDKIECFIEINKEEKALINLVYAGLHEMYPNSKTDLNELLFLIGLEELIEKYSKYLGRL